MSRIATDTKSRILKAARSLYSSHGCDRTTLEDIITTSGITKGAFYHYFKSKDSLCETLVDEVVGDYQRLVDSVDQSAEPIEQLYEIIHKLGELNAGGEWVNCRLMLRLSADSHEAHPELQRKLRQFWKWHTDFYECLVEKCFEKGQLNTQMNSMETARMIIAIIAGTITIERITPGEKVFENLAERIISILQGQPLRQ